MQKASLGVTAFGLALISLIVISITLTAGLAPVNAATEICNYEDDDGDGLCFFGTNDGFPCTDSSVCGGGGTCILVDEDFIYQGNPVNYNCDGINECGQGTVYCVDENNADCSTNPNGKDYDGVSEICDYLDNDCDGLFDEGFQYNGIDVGLQCYGVGECGKGVVECSSTYTTDCSTNPGRTDDESVPEVCNGLDDDCNAVIDNGGDALCDNGAFCDGAETCSGASGCLAGTPPVVDDGVDCTDDSCDEATDTIVNTPNDANCDNGQFCDGVETCDASQGCQSGLAVDCSGNNENGIATCANDPDLNVFTWDFLPSFTSVCDEDSDSCTTSPYSLTHTCSVADCSAECDENNTCDDKCVGDIYYSSGSCQSDCTCSYNTEDCDQYDGWYDTSTTQWVDNGQCTEKEQVLQENLDYSCNSASGCQYSVLNTQWKDTGLTRPKSDGTVCNDGVACTENDVCSSGVCGGVTKDCSSSGNQCNVGVCNEGAGGICEAQPTNEGNACNDGLFCNTGETCQSGVCTGGNANLCSDDVGCTIDTCDEDSDSCVNTATDSICDNGLFCDGIETCDTSLGCQDGSLVDCSGNNEDGIATCTNSPDGIAFTWDFLPSFTSACDEDSDSCTTSPYSLTHTCSVADCSAECDESNACNDKCVGEVYYSSGSCQNDCICSYNTEDCNQYDGWYDTTTANRWVSDEQCTEKEQKEQENRDYSCNSASGCQYSVVIAQWVDTGATRPKSDGTSCDDGAACTENDVCSSGVCGGVDKDCSSSGDQCNVGVCNEAAGGICEPQPANEGNACDDGLFCNMGEICQLGVCTGGAAVSCSDGVSCTIDTCDEDIDSCINTATDSLCDNGLFCDGNEYCDALLDCLAGTPPVVDDGVDCTDDSCDEATDIIVNTPNDANCDNGQFCDGVETCNAILDCRTGTTVDCSSFNLAAIDTCLYDPDGVDYTRDIFPGFTSVCDEAIDSCTIGTVSLTHTCSISQCGAECEADTDCADTDCDSQDGCYAGTYLDYADEPNTCDTSACVCSSNACASYTEIITDNDGDGYDIECDNDCNDSNINIFYGATEICNNLDDDCDGSVDEDFTDLGTSCTVGLGVCQSAGVMVCTSDGLGTECNAVVGSPTGSDNDCDGIDQNCDGNADENYVSDETCFLPGACSDSNVGSSCIGGVETACQTGTPATDDASCNGIDDDCDGSIDEGYISDISCFLPGTCSAFNVGSTCIFGIESACQTGTPQTEACDGFDDDCDGLTDEDYPELGDSCTVGVGECAASGVKVCSSDGTGTECNAVPGPSSDEICNDGLDNDCDGETDETDCTPQADSDEDGVPDNVDKCANTVNWTAESSLKPNHYDSSNMLDLSEAYGCSCSQILSCKPGQNTGEFKFGCSQGTMDIWISQDPDSWAPDCQYNGVVAFEGIPKALFENTDSDWMPDLFDEDIDGDGTTDDEDDMIEDSDQPGDPDYGIPDWHPKSKHYNK